MEIKLWREILNPYTLAVNEIIVKFNHVIKEYKDRGEYSPIEQVTGRVKKISSILEKAKKKNVDLDDIEDKIEDIAGIRIICQFVEDIDKVVELIKGRSDMEIKSCKDYIKNKKPSGYRSFHIIVYYNVETISGTKRIKVEIQIRTMSMNFWATIEHSLQYKYKGNIPPHISERLKSASDAIIQLDAEMSAIRDDIMDAQISNNIMGSLIADILTNIKQLYSLANKREVMKIQDEFYKIYETGDIEKLEKFHKELDIIAESYRAQKL
ncbi:MAG: GTP pyrophosphokinase family protein [Lachnospiraceae bacterium]|nr:GTP pyrophosphokinase family protein [Lachnospiraceae bacterium]